MLFAFFRNDSIHLVVGSPRGSPGQSHPGCSWWRLPKPEAHGARWPICLTQVLPLRSTADNLVVGRVEERGRRGYPARKSLLDGYLKRLPCGRANSASFQMFHSPRNFPQDLRPQRLEEKLGIRVELPCCLFFNGFGMITEWVLDGETWESHWADYSVYWQAHSRE